KAGHLTAPIPARRALVAGDCPSVHCWQVVRMKITAVRTAALTVPIARPTRIATRTLGGRDYVLAWVESDEGVSGVGYTYAGTLGGRIVQTCIDQALAPLLVGEDPFAIERHWARMFQETLLIGRRGAMLRAISCLDIA